MSDILFEAKNYFYLGNYQSAINEINKKSKQLRDDSKIEADFYIYRSYIALEDYKLVLSEISESNDNASLKAVRLLAQYLSTQRSVLDQLEPLSKLYNVNSQLQLIAATIHFQEEKYEETLRILNNTDSLECMSLLIQTYLKIDRLDLAEKQYSQMKTIDVDATPTLLSHAWILITQGEEKIKEALSTYEELSEKYGPTTLLLNGRAICEILLKRLERAENLLLLAIEKSPKDPDTIANLITCYVHMKKPTEIINRYLNQLKSISSKHHWIKALDGAEDAFERSKSRFGV